MSTDCHVGSKVDSRPDAYAADTRSPPCIALINGESDMSHLVSAFLSCCPKVDLRWGTDLGSLTEIEVAVCWRPPVGLLRQFTRLKLIQSSAAGIDHILNDPFWPRGVPICRMTDADMAGGMAAYVSWAVVHHQRRMQAYLGHAIVHSWARQPVELPASHCVGIAGMGELGRACARALVQIGYRVRGWSRQTRSEVGDAIESFHGPHQLEKFLTGCDTLICLLPLTPETRGFLSADLFSKMPLGAHLINVGRGEHLVEQDLLDALACGRLGAATLDVFAQEPLASHHPFWSHQKITVTPHVATRSDPHALARQTLNNLLLLEDGMSPATLVDVDRGY